KATHQTSESGGAGSPGWVSGLARGAALASPSSTGVSPAATRATDASTTAAARRWDRDRNHRGKRGRPDTVVVVFPGPSRPGFGSGGGGGNSGSATAVGRCR